MKLEAKNLAFIPPFLIVLLGILIQKFHWEQIETGLLWIPIRCPLKQWTGLRCAFCGMTHSWLAILRGEVPRAFQENILGPPLFLGFLVLCIWIGLGKPFPLQSESRRKSLLSALIVLVGYSILRNL